MTLPGRKFRSVQDAAYLSIFGAGLECHVRVGFCEVLLSGILRILSWFAQVSSDILIVVQCPSFIVDAYWRIRP